MEEGQLNEKVQQMKTLQQEIAVVKKELNKLNREKESWFSKRSKINKKISALIGDVKGSKDSRNELTSQVKQFKEERDQLNAQIKEKLELLKSLKANAGEKPKTSSSSMNSHGRFEKKLTPSAIKKQIEKIEYALETQPMKFSNEQKLNKEVKMLKKQLSEMSSTAGDWESITELSREINRLRKASNAAHKKLQEEAGASQVKHESVLGISKEIDDLKKEEQAAFDKFKEFKDLFKVKNDSLKELLKTFEELKTVLEENNIAVEEDKKKAAADAVREKVKVVNEKIKKGGKLTTEDLLMMQSSMKK